jgi:hypothetical protein
MSGTVKFEVKNERFDHQVVAAPSEPEARFFAGIGILPYPSAQ